MPFQKLVSNEQVIHALNLSQWNVTGAAAILGVTRHSVWKRIKKIGLVPPEGVKPFKHNAQRAKTKCKHGHAFADHSYLNKKGFRVCRACQKARDDKRAEQRRLDRLKLSPYFGAATVEVLK
jgi:hypothetical protein